MKKRILLLTFGLVLTAPAAQPVSRVLKDNPFGVLEISPFAGSDELKKQYAEITEKRVSQTNSSQERKEIRTQMVSAYKQLEKPEDWRITVYNMLINGSQGRTPNFPGLSVSESGRLASEMKSMRQTIGSRLTKGSPNIIDGNTTIEKDYEYSKKLFDKYEEPQEKKNELEKAYIVLTEPWRWKEFLPATIVEGMEMNLEQAQGYAKQRSQEDEKRRQNELNEQHERERIAQEKAEAERKAKKEAQERRKKEEERKKAEQLKKEQERKAKEEARKKQEEEDQIQIQKEREERERQKAEAQKTEEALVQPRLEWKAPILVLSKKAEAPEGIIKKVTFELKNKTRNYELAIDLLQDGDKKKSVMAAYQDEAFVAASAGKEESEHGYLRMIGLDPKTEYKLIITLIGQSGSLTKYSYTLKANQNRKRILLTFEKEGNNFVLRPQKGAVFSSKTQSGIPLEENIKNGDIKSSGLSVE